MKRNYEIVDGTCLVYEGYELDLHNDFYFKGLDYSIERRQLILHWRRSVGEWFSSNTPQSLIIEFDEVSEFRFMPRDAEMPFTEDECINSFGYWVDEKWAEGVIMLQPNQTAESNWLAAIDFMSGAVLAVQSVSANVRVVP